MTPRVLFLILSYNAGHWLEFFWPTLPATNCQDYEIILTENCSKNDNLALVQEKFPTVQCVGFLQTMASHAATTTPCPRQRQ
jgi:GT2 family glycosyltransferase